jgi:tellurite methyltransferase
VTDRAHLATAHEAWDRRWADARKHQEWLRPEQAVIDTVPLLRCRAVTSAIDIGCGAGRHALYLARQGFRLSALDASEASLAVTGRAAADAGLEIDLQLADFTALPFPDDSFDYALAWNVIYHGDGDVVRQALAEIRRILKPGGIFQGTMISKRHTRFGQGTEIRPNTFVLMDDEEKSHPHFYCNDRELIDLLSGFQLLRLEDRQQRESGTWHWEFVAEMLPET